MPALIANPTGTMAGPETSSASNQHDNSTPGAMKSTNAAAKGTNGKASRAPRRGTSRTAAAKHDSTTSTSGDSMRRVNDPLIDKTTARESIQPPTPSLKHTARKAAGASGSWREAACRPVVAWLILVSWGSGSGPAKRQAP